MRPYSHNTPSDSNAVTSFLINNTFFETSGDVGLKCTYTTLTFSFVPFAGPKPRLDSNGLGLGLVVFTHLRKDNSLDLAGGPPSDPRPLAIRDWVLSSQANSPWQKVRILVGKKKKKIPILIPQKNEG